MQLYDGGSPSCIGASTTSSSMGSSSPLPSSMDGTSVRSELESCNNLVTGFTPPPRRAAGVGEHGGSLATEPWSVKAYCRSDGSDACTDLPQDPPDHALLPALDHRQASSNRSLASSCDHWYSSWRSVVYKEAVSVGVWLARRGSCPRTMRSLSASVRLSWCDRWRHQRPGESLAVDVTYLLDLLFTFPSMSACGCVQDADSVLEWITTRWYAGSPTALLIVCTTSRSASSCKRTCAQKVSRTAPANTPTKVSCTGSVNLSSSILKPRRTALSRSFASVASESCFWTRSWSAFFIDGLRGGFCRS